LPQEIPMKMLACVAVVATAVIATFVRAATPIAATPPMGWNSWNHFGESPLSTQSTH
jgi:hypothetical protein